MALRQARMIEIVRGIVRHAELFHYPPGSHVAWHCECDNLVQCQAFEAVTQCRASAFGGQPLAPVGRPQSPGDFDAGRKVRQETRHVQPDEADESAVAAEFRGEQAESAFAKVPLNAIHALIAFSAGETRREEFHHCRIGVHACERLPVRWTPLPQDEPLGFEAGYQIISCYPFAARLSRRRRSDRRNRASLC